MSECVDQEARDRIAKIWTEIREHATDYWGPDKQNGKRSEVVELGNRVDIIEEKMQHYEDTREQNCIGLAALNKYLSVRKQDETQIRVEKIKAGFLMFTQLLQIAGLIVVAIITLKK